MANNNKSEKPLLAQTQFPMYPFKHGLDIWCMPIEDFKKDGNYAFTDVDVEVLETTVGFPLSNKSLSALQHLLAKKSKLFTSKSVEEWNWPNIITMLESLEIENGHKSKEKSSADNNNKPLSDKTIAVLDLLKELRPNTGLTGPKILKKLYDKNIIFDQSTLTKSIIPALKPYGVKNKPRIGYYLANK